jgi:hypothetical protein
MCASLCVRCCRSLVGPARTELGWWGPSTAPTASVVAQPIFLLNRDALLAKAGCVPPAWLWESRRAACMTRRLSMLQPLPALARAQATSTLNFFQEFRRFSNKLVADAAGLKASLQAPPEPITKVQRECNRRRPLLSFWPLPPLALRPAPHARSALCFNSISSVLGLRPTREAASSVTSVGFSCRIVTQPLSPRPRGRRCRGQHHPAVCVAACCCVLL